MKKFITLLLAVLMVASLAACGSNNSAPAADGSAAASSVQLKILDSEYVTEDYAIAVAKENTDLLDSINTALTALIADGTVAQVVDYYVSGEGELPAVQQDVAADAETLTMATNAAFPPYEYWEGDAIVGIDAVVAGLIADQLGMKLDIQDMDFDAIIPAVVSGKVDMGMAGMTVTDERLQSVSFSESYATGVQVVIVPENSPIETVDQLFSLLDDGEDIQIGTQNATTGFIYASDDFGEEHVQAFNKGADAVQALVSGKLTCVIIDNEPAKAFVAANNG
ncbi:MAG: transporter substrate-binding domain-containing protein [Oscillospiraceae bacterium]|nr:transporter substrate-binding domain-containing protein [Oscillospiraceae bacterium]MBQ6402626.1 transporter substrate-binding domain-containing protein [Oscillospiraceae bacterium]